MNHETFIKTEINRGIEGDFTIIREFSFDCMQKYKRNEFDTVPSLIMETREKIKKRLALCDWVTIKEFMVRTGLSEYKTRKHMQNWIASELAEVNREERPYKYRAI